jgi:Co/Zn/Cd efflux system component
VHVWSLTSGRRLATLHLKLERGAPPAPALAAVRSMLSARFAIEHSTIELDLDPAETLSRHRTSEGS